MVRNLRRPAHRAEEDRVVPADLFLPVLRHHALMLGVVVVGGEVEVVLPQFEAEFFGGGFEHAHALRHHLLADAVARNDGDAVDAIGGHGRFPPEVWRVTGGVHYTRGARIATRQPFDERGLPPTTRRTSPAE